MSNYMPLDVERQAKPYDDDVYMERIEVEFALPVYVPTAALRELDGLLSSIIRLRRNQPVGGVHWISGYGAKPSWSQVDARLLGKTPASDAPLRGEPTWDENVYYIETTARPLHPKEEARETAKKERDVHLTPSEVMALRSVLAEYIKASSHVTTFYDALRQVETTPEDLLRKLQELSNSKEVS
jgi:hypothetical protein